MCKQKGPTQKELVIEHFKAKGTISGLEAISLYRITSLTKVISELVRHGLDIKTEWREDNTQKRYKRYYSNGIITQFSI